MGGEAGVRLQRGGLLGGAGKGDIHLAGLQQAQYLVAAAGNDLDVDGGILPVEPIQIRQQELAGDGVAGADGQVSHLQLPALGQLLLAGLQQADGAADVLVQHPAVRCQGHATGVAGKQTGLQLALQLLDGLADGGLGDIQGLSGGGDVAGLGHLLEYTIKLQFHRHDAGPHK